MAEDGESQAIIKFYLEAFLPYICECVKATDLLVHLQFFNKLERKEVFSLSCVSTGKSSEATKRAFEILMRKDEPGLYTAIKEAMGPEQANIPKVCQILSGNFIPSEEEEHYNRLIRLFMNELLNRISPTDLVPYLYREGVLVRRETEQIKLEERNNGRWHAAWLLLHSLPQRVENWFKIFLKALIESKQPDLAEKLDPDLYLKLTAQAEPYSKTKDPECTEMKTDLLEVFEDAIDDEKLLGSVEEKYDQEKSEKETSVNNDKISEETVPTKQYEDTTHDVQIVDIHMTTGVSGLTSGGSSSVAMNELKEMDVSPKSERISLNSSETEASIMTHGADDSRKEVDPEKYYSAEDFNMDTNIETKPFYVKSLHGTEGMLSEKDSTDNLGLFDSSLVLTDISTPSELRSVSTDEPVVKPKTKELKVADFEGQNIVLDRSELTRTFKEQPRNRGALRNTSKYGWQPNPISQKERTDVDIKTLTPSEELNSLDVSSIKLEESGSVDEIRGATNDNKSDEDDLKDLVDSLNTYLMTSGFNLSETDSVPVQYGEIDIEDVNDLNKPAAGPAIATDLDDAESDDEQVIPLRGYQKELAKEGCEGENVIILAPTNSGKTWVACKIIQVVSSSVATAKAEQKNEHFHRSKGLRIAKCAFVVENTNLAQQQGECCASLLKHLRTKVVSGETQRDKKEYLKDFVDRRDILVVTAKVLHNTLMQKDIDSIQKFSLLVFDECHHTQSDHPYNEIMHLYHEVRTTLGIDRATLPQVIGLTASLGVGGEVTLEKAVKHMQALMANLDARCLCRVKDRNSIKELEEYQNTPDEDIIIVPARRNDSFRKSVSNVMKAIEGLIIRTREMLIPVDVLIINKIIKSIPAEKGSQPYIQWLSDFEKRLAELRSEDMRRVLNSCRLHLMDYNQAILLYNDARVEDALELLKERMEEKRNSAITEIEKIMFQIYDKLINMHFDECSFNPKLTKMQDILLEVLGNDENGRGIIFVKTRLLAQYLIKWMKSTDVLQVLNPTPFVGQNAPSELGGMTKHEQKDVLVYFKDGLHKLIIATSVAEEGLDITKCNLVIRYEHVTNEIVRTQSRGRARAPNSKYFVITGKGSQIADKEEKNAKQEELMNVAVIALEKYITRNRQVFGIQQQKLQFTAKLKRDMKETRRRERLVDGDFELQCYHCSSFICMSSDVKKIQGVHHVCIADDIRERVNFARSPLPQFEESDIKMDGATTCKNCQHPLGGVCDYKSIEFPLFKIRYFRVVDMNGKGSHHKKWKGVSFKVEDIEVNDLLAFARANNSDSD